LIFERAEHHAGYKEEKYFKKTLSQLVMGSASKTVNIAVSSEVLELYLFKLRLTNKKRIKDMYINWI